MLRIMIIMVGIVWGMLTATVWGMQWWGSVVGSPLLVFVSERHDNQDLVVADVRTGWTLPLTHHPDRDANADWSPDGRYLRFFRTGLDGFRTMVFDLDAGTVLQVPINPAEQYGRTWWLNATQLQIMLQSGGDVVFDVPNEETLSGTNADYATCAQCFGDAVDLLYYLAETRAEGFFVSVYEPDPSLYRMFDRAVVFPSPDGQQYAFVADVDGDEDIYVLAGREGYPINITADHVVNNMPIWSPDGDWLVFMTYDQRNPDIGVYHLPTGRTYNLSRHPARDHTPVWQPTAR